MIHFASQGLCLSQSRCQNRQTLCQGFRLSFAEPTMSRGTGVWPQQKRELLGQ